MSLMDTTTKPLTFEQRAAWLRVVGKGPTPLAGGVTLETDLKLLRPFIADDLLAALFIPTVVAEPGHYEDEEGFYWLYRRVPVPSGGSVDEWVDHHGDVNRPPTGQMTRLVPERPQVTVEAVLTSWGSLGFVDQATRVVLAEAAVALLNGADQ